MVLEFFLQYPPVLVILFFSIIVAIIVNFAYKVLVNQEQAGNIKERMKEIQQQAKDARKQGDIKKYNELISSSMKENSKIMRMTMKPMFVSMIVVILFFFPLLGILYGDINMDSDLGVLKIHDKSYTLERTGSTLKISDNTCELPCKIELDDAVWKVRMESNKIIFARVIAKTPISLPYFGNEFGWLGWYILCSIPVMIIIRRMMKIVI